MGRISTFGALAGVAALLALAASPAQAAGSVGARSAATGHHHHGWMRYGHGRGGFVIDPLAVGAPGPAYDAPLPDYAPQPVYEPAPYSYSGPVYYPEPGLYPQPWGGAGPQPTGYGVAYNVPPPPYLRLRRGPHIIYLAHGWRPHHRLHHSHGGMIFVRHGFVSTY